MTLFILGKNEFTMLKYNQYNNYKNQQQKKAPEKAGSA